MSDSSTAVDLDSLGLMNGGPRTRGRAARPPVATLGRELTPADLALLETERGIKPPPIAKLRDSHHQLARALAAGMRAAEASVVTGYTANRISILQSDPTFKELIAFYRDNLDQVYADLHGRMASMSLDFQAELHQRLIDNPDSMDNKFLAETLKMLADRTGYGPKQTTVNVNVDLSARLQAARRRVAEAPTIEGTAVQVAESAPPPDEEPVP
jgi:hypothetical protein